jgi:predicted ATPase/transcriptional regulator with XRE-family HTH domain
MPSQPGSFGVLLKRYRLAATLSQEALAERAGVSVRGISDLERGLVRAPRLDTLARLGDALGLERPHRQVLAAAAGYAPAKESEAQAPARELSAGAEHSGAPVFLTQLLGREGELAAIGELFGRAEVRLLTLMGSGGVGKTRLAAHVCSQLVDNYDDGVVFVPLAPLRDAALVPTTIARAIGAGDSGDDVTLDGLVQLLRARHLVLVLDNFEHLLDAAPDVGELLAQCPHLKVLATSRSPLRIAGEQLFYVHPLRVPIENQVATPSDALQFPSVALFVERARAAQHGFRLTADNLESVLAISRRLDGLPLALELAAARIPVLPPAALLARLERSVDVLAGGARDAPARHRAVTCAIAWSHDLLAAEHQILFRRLSTFAGGWTLDAAEQMGAHAESNRSLLEGLSALVDQSLVQVSADKNGEPRFGLLETIRAHALDRLQSSGEAAEVRARHAQIFVDLAEEAEWHLNGPDRASWLERLEVELDNCRSALAWSLTDDGNPEIGQRLVGSLSWFWYFRGDILEGRTWAERLIVRSVHTPAEIRARALFALGGMALMQGDPPTARRALEESVSLFRKSGDRRRLAQAVALLGMAAESVGMPSWAFELHQEAVELARAIDDRWLRALALSNQGAASQRLGEFEAAGRLFQSSLSVFCELEDPWGYSIALRGLAGLLLDRGEPATARALYEQSAPLFRMTGDNRGLAQTLLGLGKSALHSGAAERAREAFAEALTRWKAVNITAGVIRSVIGLAGVAHAVSNHDRAATLYAAAETLGRKHAVSLSVPDAANRARRLASIREELGQSRFEALWCAGRSLSLDETIQSALT